MKKAGYVSFTFCGKCNYAHVQLHESEETPAFAEFCISPEDYEKFGEKLFDCLRDAQRAFEERRQ